MLQILQKAKFLFQSAAIRNPHVSDFYPRFEFPKTHPNVKIQTCLLGATGNKLLQRCKKWTYYCYHLFVALLWKMDQFNVLETLLFLFSVTFYTLIVNHALSSYPCKKNIKFILRQKTITSQKSATFQKFRIFSNKRRASNKSRPRPLISAASLLLRSK